MSRLKQMGVVAGLLVFAFGWPTLSASAPNQAIPNFAPDDRTSWFPDRPMGDDYLPPPSGPGPVLADPAHPYTPNDEGRNTGVQPTYRIADLGGAKPDVEINGWNVE